MSWEAAKAPCVVGVEARYGRARDVLQSLARVGDHACVMVAQDRPLSRHARHNGLAATGKAGEEMRLDENGRMINPRFLRTWGSMTFGFRKPELPRPRWRVNTA